MLERVVGAMVQNESFRNITSVFSCPCKCNVYIAPISIKQPLKVHLLSQAFIIKLSVMEEQVRPCNNKLVFFAK